MLQVSQPQQVKVKLSPAQGKLPVVQNWSHLAPTVGRTNAGRVYSATAMTTHTGGQGKLNVNPQQGNHGAAQVAQPSTSIQAPVTSGLYYQSPAKAKAYQPTLQGTTLFRYNNAVNPSSIHPSILAAIQNINDIFSQRYIA